MRKILVGSIAALMLLGIALPTLAAPARLVRLDGWVVDQWCGKKNANGDGAGCVIECHEKGAPLVFASDDGKTYTIVDQDGALDQVGVHVKIFGTIDSEGNLSVGSYKPIEDAGSEKETGS